MAEQWQVAGIEQAIRAATQRGESLTIADVQEETGVEADVAKDAMQVLRDRGSIVGDDTDGFRVPGSASAEPVPDEDIDPVPVEAPGEPAGTESYGEVAPGAWEVPFQPRSADATFAMPRAMIHAIDDESLGKMIKAGVESIPGDFVLHIS
jgi:hypothetical protein